MPDDWAIVAFTLALDTPKHVFLKTILPGWQPHESHFKLIGPHVKLIGRPREDL
jgi:hypothetical protein